MRRFDIQWNGKLSIRSGTAKLSILPDWTWGKEEELNLTHFPGALFGWFNRPRLNRNVWHCSLVVPIQYP